jgi:hypothetical protein
MGTHMNKWIVHNGEDAKVGEARAHARACTYVRLRPGSGRMPVTAVL